MGPLLALGRAFLSSGVKGATARGLVQGVVSQQVAGAGDQGAQQQSSGYEPVKFGPPR